MPERSDKRRTLTATEVARNLSEVINRVRYMDETVVVERGGMSVCEIRPVYGAPLFTGADLADLLLVLPSPGEQYLEAVEAGIDSQPVAQKTSWRR